MRKDREADLQERLEKRRERKAELLVLYWISSLEGELSASRHK